MVKYIKLFLIFFVKKQHSYTQRKYSRVWVEKNDISILKNNTKRFKSVGKT